MMSLNTGMQPLLAPFVLDNLNCSGTETRLLDCPGATQAAYDDSYDPYSSTTYPYSEPPNSCDPLEGTFAMVACGMTDGAGVAKPAVKR